jgi:hypothetical protein
MIEQVDHHLSKVRPSSHRADTYERVPVLLLLQRLRRMAEAPAWGLLRVLFAWIGAVSANSGS